MTAVKSTIVAVPATEANERLARDIHSAYSRALKADPGDRVDIVRFESLSVELEKRAAMNAFDSTMVARADIDDGDTPGFSFQGREYADGDDLGLLLERLPADVARRAQGWIDDGHIVVWLRDPLHTGAARPPAPEVPVPEPAEVWRADDATGKRAVIQRFRAQLREATKSGTTEAGTINPSGINNQVITEELRDFVIGTADTTVRVTVAYRDGSQAANTFALRCLPLLDQLEEPSEIELRLALLSIRHVEMDAVIDGAWLRNAEVSRSRPAALTDDFVFATSQQQLAELTRHGTRSATIHLFQTGLDQAVVGFYRAVVEHLLVHPGNLAVIPMFYASGGEAEYVAGVPWATRRDQ